MNREDTIKLLDGLFSVRVKKSYADGITYSGCIYEANLIIHYSGISNQIYLELNNKVIFIDNIDVYLRRWKV